MTDLNATEFATVLAHLEHFGPDHRSAVCARLGTDEPAYLRAASRLPGDMTRAAAAGDLQPVETFGAAFKKAKADLSTRKPTLEEVPPLPSRARKLRLAAPSMNDSQGSGEHTLDPSSARSRGRALPFQPGLVAPPPPAVHVAPDPSGETVAASPDAGATAATPFEQRELAAWTVEKYAAFMADRRAGDLDTVRAAYDVRDEAFESLLLSHFNKQFGRDPSLRTRWLALMVERTRQTGRG